MAATATEEAHDVIMREINLSAKGCIEWGLAKDRDGYGVFGRNGKQIRAHRASWEINRGPIPRGMFVLHRCDNPSCINIEHLFLGDHKENMLDRDRKGRTKRGSSHGMATISEQTAIRIKMVKGFLDAIVVAKLVGIKKSQVCNIMNGDSWKNVTAETRYSF